MNRVESRKLNNQWKVIFSHCYLLLKTVDLSINRCIFIYTFQRRTNKLVVFLPVKYQLELTDFHFDISAYMYSCIITCIQTE